MIMFYRVDAPVQAGTLINYGGHTFIALNKETIENDVYYKSSVVRTNGVFNTHNLAVIGLPFYSSTINNSTATNGVNLSIIDGNAEVLTEDCPASRALVTDDLFNEWRRTWKITNLFYIDGICHVIMEVSADVTPKYDYKIVLSPLTSYHVTLGDTDRLTAAAYINDNEIPNATIEFSSSNDEVATIDADGNIEYLTDGEVSFTALWTEQDVSATTDDVTVQTEPADEDVSIFMELLETVYCKFESDFLCYALRGGARDDSIPVTVRAENVSGVSNQSVYLSYIKITNLGNGKFEVLADNTNLLGKSFDLVATIEGYDAIVRQTVRVASLW